MALPTISRPGRVLNAGDDNAQFLKLMAGEVLAAFQDANVMMPLHYVKTITSGKSAAFPVIGKASSEYHVAGEDMLVPDGASTPAGSYLNGIKTTEKEIFVDDPLVSPILLPDIDALKNHYDHRSFFTNAMGAKLAKDADTHVINTLAAAQDHGENISGETGTSYATAAVDCTVGANLVAKAFECAQELDERAVSKQGRYFLVRPKQYYLLAQETDLVNRDFVGGNGDYAKATLGEVAGMQIVVSNNFGTANSKLTDPNKAIGGDSYGQRNDPAGAEGIGYNVDLSDVGALAFTRDSIGTVKMKDIGMETDRIATRMSWFVNAFYIMGHGVLRPECVATVKASAL